MKQRYSKVPLFLALFTLIFYLPTRSFSQCLCANGTTPLTLEYTLVGNISPSTDSTIFVFPKFDPTTGTLICVNAKAYVTSIIRMKLENDEIFEVSNYRIRYTRNDQLTGPGISPPITGSLTKNYGPYWLDRSDVTYFSGTDYMTIGPDTVYKNKLFEGTTTNVIPYLGPGTVNFTYKVMGSTNVTGSSNYIFSISANDRVDFYMTYSYCNTGILPLNIKEFAATKKDDHNISISWITENETKNTSYEIEASENGLEFSQVGLKNSAVANSSSVKYEYQYHLDQLNSDKIFLRIKQKDGNGNSKYSSVRTVEMKDQIQDGFRIYPNPVVRRVSMQFNKSLKGNYVIEVISSMGQVMYKQPVTMNDNTMIQFMLPNRPAPGIYQLRLKDVRSKQVFTGKLLIQR